MPAQDYTVRLDSFHGPLDLLLFLIRRAEVDVSEISLAAITDQYMAFIGRIEDVDVDGAGEFLVTAATLIELKSRMLAPASEGDEEGAGAILEAAEREGPGAAEELIRQLLQFKRCREAAEKLEAGRRVWETRYPLRALATPAGPLPEQSESCDLEDVRLYDLVEAFGRIVETVQFDRLGEHEIGASDTPIELHAADILERLRSMPSIVGTERPALSMRGLFVDRTRLEVVGLFLAVLELVRQRVLRVEVNPGTREVEVRLAPQDSEEAPTGAGEPAASGAA